MGDIDFQKAALDALRASAAADFCQGYEPDQLEGITLKEVVRFLEFVDSHPTIAHQARWEAVQQRAAAILSRFDGTPDTPPRSSTVEPEPCPQCGFVLWAAPNPGKGCGHADCPMATTTAEGEK